MNLGEKIRMAEALTELGVDVIEAGFAIASPGDFESVKAISCTLRSSVPPASEACLDRRMRLIGPA
jgi:2-isopropylmalate synthase